MLLLEVFVSFLALSVSLPLDAGFCKPASLRRWEPFVSWYDSCNNQKLGTFRAFACSLAALSLAPNFLLPLDARTYLQSLCQTSLAHFVLRYASARRSCSLAQWHQNRILQTLCQTANRPVFRAISRWHHIRILQRPCQSLSKGNQTPFGSLVTLGIRHWRLG